ncbi:MAG: hypothetical protein JST55_05915 [Bacteroidetes bacterium]|nr:hypothetical protein [Bacteroidota bacterium]
MSYTYHEVTDIINSQKPFLESKYGLEKIGIFNFQLDKHGVKEADFLVRFKKPIGMKFIDFTEFIESLLNVDGEFLTEEGLESLNDEAFKNGIKNKVHNV